MQELQAANAVLKKRDERKAKLAELTQRSRDLNSRLALAEIEFLIALDHQDRLSEKLSEKLHARIKELQEEVAKDRREASQLTQPRNPPAKAVRGKVTAADMATGYVTINLGSDDGLTKGNTLEVFRRQPKPTYVGVFRVVEVQKNESVGRMINRTGMVQLGDEVADEILDKR